MLGTLDSWLNFRSLKCRFTSLWVKTFFNQNCNHLYTISAQVKRLFFGDFLVLVWFTVAWQVGF